MKKILLLRIVLVLFTVLLSLQGCQDQNEEQKRHIVIFKYKPDATDEEIEKVTEALGGLKETIPGIVSFEYGVNDSPEDFNKEFTHVYMFTFEDAAARDAYLPHPKHKEFGKMLGNMDVVEDIFVVDYSPEK